MVIRGGSIHHAVLHKQPPLQLHLYWYWRYDASLRTSSTIAILILTPYYAAARIAAFLVCTVAELAVWVAVLLVGVQVTAVDAREAAVYGVNAPIYRAQALIYGDRCAILGDRCRKSCHVSAVFWHCCKLQS